MKRVICFILCFCFLSPLPFLDSYADEEIVDDSGPIEIGSFIMTYLMSASDMGLDVTSLSVQDIEKFDPSVSIGHAYLYVGDGGNTIKNALFELPSDTSDDYRDALIYLIAFMYAFQTSSLSILEYSEIAAMDLRGIFAASTRNPYRIGNYKFHSTELLLGHFLIIVSY